MGPFRKSPTGKMEVFILFPYTMGKLSTEKQTYPQCVDNTFENKIIRSGRAFAIIKTGGFLYEIKNLFIIFMFSSLVCVCVLTKK